MTDWRTIDTADTESSADVLVSDGRYVALAWHCDDEGWIDSTDPQEGTLPQPTHWQPMPGPPDIPDGHLGDGTPLFIAKVEEKPAQ